MLEIVYFSNYTNYTHRMIQNLDWGNPTHRINVKGETVLNLENPYVLICPSYGDANHGHVPPQVRKFLAKPEHRNQCVGVIGSGNINFGKEYARAGDVISAKLQVPLLYKFELAGTTEDITRIREGLGQFQQHIQNLTLVNTGTN